MLPQGYTRVEWIGCDGAQYIDTGLKMTGNSSVRIKFKMQNVASDNSPIYPIYGAATNYDSNAFELWGVSNGFATYGSQSFKSQFGMTAGIEQEAFQDKNVLNFEGQTVTFTKQTFTTPVNLLLFATNRNGTIYQCEAGAGLVIMQAQIYDNGTLVRDYIPCRNPDGEAGLYDMVNGRFYGNDGTGEFVCGRALAFPEHYKRLAYIESTGTQAINTGLYPNQDMRIVMDVVQNTISNIGVGTGFCAYGGGEAGSNAFEFYTWTSQYQCNYGNQQKYIAAAVGDRLHIDQNKNVLSLTRNGVKTDYTYTYKAFAATRELYLCAINRDGIDTTYRGSVTIEACQIYDNGVLVRDYVPCQTDTGEVGLYDMATAMFYGNDGTGEFVAGLPDTTLDAPKSLEYTQAGGAVSLTWEESSGAETYRVYRDYSMIAETVSTEYIDTITDAPTAHVYAVTAVNEYGESDFSPSARVEAWGDTAPELIYDRTQADVDTAKALIVKHMRGEGLDRYEQDMWDRGLRGCYNTSDLNRVEYHTRELQSVLNTNGYNIHIDTQLWAKPDIMRYSDIARYLGNIETILDAFGRSANAPELPTIDVWIDYIVANDIEKILFVTRELILGALAMFRRAGTFAAGNDYVTQVIRRA